MIFGVASWAAWEWLFPVQITVPPAWPLPLRALSTFGRTLPRNAIGQLSAELTFTYIGAVLLIVAHNPVWLQRLGAFGITGRMALTNYMLQIMIIEFTFKKYRLGLRLSSACAPLAALMLFAVVRSLLRELAAHPPETRHAQRRRARLHPY